MSSQSGTRERIVSAANSLLARSGSIEAVSINDIIRSAGVARGTFYRHFPSKAQLGHELGAEPQASAGRRDQILDAAQRVFPLRGLRGTTVEQIAADAGIGAATIYWHFNSKEELIAAMLRRVAPTDLAERLASVPDHAPPQLVLGTLARGIAARFAENAGLLRLVFAEIGFYPELSATLFEQIIGPVWTRVTTYLDRQIELGRFRPGDSRSRMFCLIGPVIANLLATSTFGAERVGASSEAVMNEAIDNFLRAVST